MSLILIILISQTSKVSISMKTQTGSFKTQKLAAISNTLTYANDWLSSNNWERDLIGNLDYLKLQKKKFKSKNQLFIKTKIMTRMLKVLNSQVTNLKVITTNLNLLKRLNQLVKAARVSKTEKTIWMKAKEYMIRSLITKRLTIEGLNSKRISSIL